MKLIGIGMIGNPNCIGTGLCGSIQEIKTKENNSIQFLQEKLIDILERLIGLTVNF